MENRAASDFEILEDREGRLILGNVRKSEEQQRQDEMDFFGSLPASSYTEEEITLRDAVLTFLGSYTQKHGHSPRLGDVGSDPTVKTARVSLLPEEFGLKTWI